MTNKYSQLSFHDLSLRFYYKVNNLSLKIIVLVHRQLWSKPVEGMRPHLLLVKCLINWNKIPRLLLCFYYYFFISKILKQVMQNCFIHKSRTVIITTVNCNFDCCLKLFLRIARCWARNDVVGVNERKHWVTSTVFWKSVISNTRYHAHKLTHVK